MSIVVPHALCRIWSVGARLPGRKEFAKGASASGAGDSAAAIAPGEPETTKSWTATVMEKPRSNDDGDDPSEDRPIDEEVQHG
jgi:hypothetical protein